MRIEALQDEQRETKEKISEKERDIAFTSEYNQKKIYELTRALQDSKENLLSELKESNKYK